MKKVIAVFSIFLTTNIFYSNGQIMFQKMYGSWVVDEWGREAHQTKDKGYIGLGGIANQGWPDIVLFKTDSNGTMIWDRIISSPNVAGIGGVGSVCEVDSDCYVVSGADLSSGSLLFKINSNGNVIWSSGLGGSQGFVSHCLTSDSGFLAIGASAITGNQKIFLVKFNSLGDTLWNRHITSIGDEAYGISVIQTRKGDYALTGWISNNGTYNSEIFIIRIDTTGNVIWFDKFLGSGGEGGKSICETQDSGFIIAGETTSSGAGNSDAILIKTDSLGNMLWSKTYGGADDDYGSSIYPIDSGNFMMYGTTSSFGIYQDALLLKVDANGNVLSSKIFNDCHGSSMDRTIDTGFIMTGTMYPYSSDIHLIKTNRNGDSYCNETPVIISINSSVIQNTNPQYYSYSVPSPLSSPAIDVVNFSSNIESTICLSSSIQSSFPSSLIRIFPDPVKFKLILKSQELINSIIIFNSLGEKVLAANLPSALSPLSSSIDVSSLPPGIYLLSATSDVGVRTAKFIKE